MYKYVFVYIPACALTGVLLTTTPSTLAMLSLPVSIAGRITFFISFCNISKRACGETAENLIILAVCSPVSLLSVWLGASSHNYMYMYVYTCTQIYMRVNMCICMNAHELCKNTRCFICKQLMCSAIGCIFMKI